MPNLVKKMLVRELTEQLKEAEGMLFVSMKGLTVAESEEIRDKLAEDDVPLRMVRNRLTRLALKERGLDPPREMIYGNVAISWGGAEEAIRAARVVGQAPARKDGRLGFLGGLLDGNLLGAEEAAELAKIPGWEELRARILGCLSGPARGLVGLLAAPGGSLARVLQARVDAGGDAGGEPEPE